MWWVGTRKGLFSVREGAVASSHFLGVPVTVALARGNRVWVAVEHGHYGPKVHRSEDGGVTFEEVAAPAFPPVEEGDGPSVQTIWALEQGSDDRLWLGTIPGGLFTSDDGGDSWRLVESLWNEPGRSRWFGGGADEPGIHSVCVNPQDPADVLVGVSCGGAWRTRDGGEHWTLCATGMVANYMPPERSGDPGIQDPHCIVRSPSDVDVLWCQHHCGIFRSTDHADTWQQIEVPNPSSFGFPVAVHPHDPDTAWFIPATSDEHRIPVDGKVVVTRTRDGGKTFDVLTRGLPQEHAYDLVFRHALAIDDSGERLAFGSTTGGLWETDDGGDHWRTVSQHLPPVYCVIPAA